MSGDERVERHGRKDVAIMNEQRRIADPIADVAKPAASFEQDGFVEKCDVAVFGVGGEIIPCFGQVMGVDGESSDADFGAGIHGPCRDGLVKQRYEGLGQAIGERSQASAQTGAKDECLMHEMAMPPMFPAGKYRS